MGNTFYAACGQERDQSWKAFFFGSLDPGSFITVDKPPASLWVMELSGRIFGFSSWSMLLPEALAACHRDGALPPGATVDGRAGRRFGGGTGAHARRRRHLRYNDPDAFLTLLLVLRPGPAGAPSRRARRSASCCRARSSACLPHQDTRRLHRRAGSRTGLPVVWPTPPGPRIANSLGRVGPARLERRWCHRRTVAEECASLHRGQHGQLRTQSDFRLQRLRPDIRLGRRWCGGGTTSGGSSARWWRGALAHVRQRVGGQISWLLPLAVVGVVAGLWLTRRNRRTDGRRPDSSCGAPLSDVPGCLRLRQGHLPSVLHVVMAPAIAALAGAGAVALWRLGASPSGGPGCSGHHCGHGALGGCLAGPHQRVRPLGRTPVVVTGVVSALTLFSAWCDRRARAGSRAGRTMAAASILAGPAAYSLTTVGTTTSAMPPPGHVGRQRSGRRRSVADWTGGRSWTGWRWRTGWDGNERCAHRTRSLGRVPATLRCRRGRRIRWRRCWWCASTVSASVCAVSREAPGRPLLVAVNGSQSAAPFILEAEGGHRHGGFGAVPRADTE